MRVDNRNPHVIYKDYWDWLFNCREHKIFILAVAIGYVYYLVTTTEVLTR